MVEKRLDTEGKRGFYRLGSVLLAIVASRALVNYLNMNHLKLTQINERTITLRPITLRDSFLMESVARSALILASLQLKA